MARKPCVYRYIDDDSDIVKYIGIVYKGSLSGRLQSHKHDKWAYDCRWRIEYFECRNRSEAEAFESHLISLYGTDKYYNKAKTNWGLNRFLPDIENKWRVIEIPMFYDKKSLLIFKIFKKLLKNKQYSLAKIFAECFTVEEMEYVG